MPNIRWLLALITHLHRGIFRVTGGRIGARGFGMRFLLLRHVGRRSGLKRLTPLLYVTDGDTPVVAASNCGDANHPAWWCNLQEHPHAGITIGQESWEVEARAATPDECARLWPKLIASYRFFADYQRRTTRRIPIVIFERRRETDD